MDENETTESLQSVSVMVPAILHGTANGVNWTLNVPAIPDGERERICRAIFAQGVLIMARTAEAGKDLETRKKGTLAKIARLQDGTATFKGGGTKGPRQPADVRGWLVYLKAAKHQEAGKDVTAQTLRRAQETLCRRAILAKAGPNGSAERKAVEANIAKHISDRFDKWLTWFEEADTKLAKAIAAEVAKDEARNTVADDLDFADGDF